MAIIHKGTSPATLEDNRANSLKSNGPVAERGLLVSRRNAVKHWGFSLADLTEVRSLCPALGTAS